MGVKGKSPRLSEEEIERIVKFIYENRGINRSTYHLLIKNYIPLAIHLTRKFCPSYLMDDCISVSFLAIVKAVNRIPDLDNLTSFSGYVNKTIICDLKRFVLTDGVIQLKSNRLKGNEHLRKIFPIKDNDAIYVEYPSLEIEELIGTVVKNELEKTIIDCILKGGYKKKDISKICGKSPGWVGYTTERLLKRLNDVL